MLRVVADTNVLVSALVFRGLPAEIVQAAEDKRIRLLSSKELLDELDDVFQRKFKFDATKSLRLQGNVRAVMQEVTPTLKVNAVKADEDDNRVIECAIAGKADCIVSGDRHLTELRVWEGIEIITPREFVRRYL
jgi:uncharacterized protein